MFSERLEGYRSLYYADIFNSDRYVDHIVQVDGNLSCDIALSDAASEHCGNPVSQHC